MAQLVAHDLSRLSLNDKEAYLARKFDKESDANVRKILRRSLYNLPLYLVGKLVEQAFIGVLEGTLTYFVFYNGISL